MKKQFILLAAGVLFLLSCNTTTKPSHDQVIIDSAVNAKVAARDAENARKNDSIINVAAKIKAEAIQNELDQENKKKEAAKTINTTPKAIQDSIHKKQ